MSALVVRLTLGGITMTMVIADLLGAAGIAILVALPLMSAPVVMYVLLFKTLRWSVGVGSALVGTWLVMRLPLSDDGLHGVYWFTAVPVILLLVWAAEVRQLRRAGG